MITSELRLLDLQPTETICVRCQCGRTVEFPYGALQRRHRLPSSFLIYDLQFRLRCQQCGEAKGFRISVFDEADRNSTVRTTERLVVGEKKPNLKIVADNGTEPQPVRKQRQRRSKG